jgi:TatA/E family protein of Tat protein translocase
MIPNIGPMEIAIVLILGLVIFGPKRLPELGSSLGKGIRGFGKGIKGEDEPEVDVIEPGVQQTEQRAQLKRGEPVQ